MRYTPLLALLVLLTLSVGCGNPSVSGKVTYSDGTPLDVGKVMFTDGQKSGFGTISSTGEYKMGMIKAGDGIPNGTYNVYITEATKEDPSLVIKDDEGGTFTLKSLVIDPKFADPKKSGLSCTVSGKTTFDITVEKPGPNYKPKVTTGD